MKIGIDAKWYFEGPPSGKIVVRNLVENLITLFPQHHFYLFFDKKFKNQSRLFQQKNVTIVYLWGRINLVANVFVLPFRAWKYKLDVVVFQYFASLFGNFFSIAFIHDIIFESNPHHFSLAERIYFSPIKFLSQHSKRICTVSENEKKRLIKYGYGNDSTIDVIYNGVNKQYKPKNTFSDEIINSIKKKYNLPQKYLLYIGRLNDRKNLKNLIESLSLTNATELPLLLFGSYDWKSINLDEIIARNNLQHRVFRKGFADQEDLPVIYSLATVFTFVSYEEGFGLPVLEAMASGVPCVVADTPVFRELYTNSVLYANPNDLSNIAQQIYLLVEDTNLYAELRRKGQERASFFCWERSAKSLMESIEKVKIFN